MKINWKVRMRNKNFWITLIPAVLIFVQNVARAVGIEIDISVLSENVLSIINSLFAVLAIMGIVVDHTTDGMTDSDRAMIYQTPYEDIEM